MLLPEFFDFLLSTARAACGLGIVFTAVAVGKWSYWNPEPTWKDTWRTMPKLFRVLSIGLTAVFLGSHLILTIREFGGGEDNEFPSSQPKMAKQAAPESPGETGVEEGREQVTASQE